MKKDDLIEGFLICVAVAAAVAGIWVSLIGLDHLFGGTKSGNAARRADAIHRVDVLCGPVVAKQFRFTFGPERAHDALGLASLTTTGGCKIPPHYDKDGSDNWFSP